MIELAQAPTEDNNIQCSSRKKLKRFEEFNIDKTRSNGRRSQCKECLRKRIQEYHENNREINKLKTLEQLHEEFSGAKKTCPGCSQELPLENFPRSNHTI